MQPKTTIKLLSSIILMSMSMASMADNKTTTNEPIIIDEPSRKAVGHVSWQKQIDNNPKKVMNKAVADNMTSLIFVRRRDADPKETGANISVNDRFQVSLHPDSYTQVYSCAGQTSINVEITGKKSNDLSSNPRTLNLQGGETYFFYVDIDDETYRPSFVQITAESAKPIVMSKKYQSHQVSRVITDCTEVAKTPTPVPQKQPVLTKEVSIELEVLFDTDKHFIKPKFEDEVADVAEFMSKYKNTTAIIEGHTDSRASISYNQKLSERRAKAVETMLINKFGISASRLQSIGYGELRPRAPNDTPANLQLNRRTIAVIKEKVVVDQNGNQITE